MAPLRLSLDGGNDAIVQLVSRAPALTPANDPRPWQLRSETSHFAAPTASIARFVAEVRYAD